MSELLGTVKLVGPDGQSVAEPSTAAQQDEILNAIMLLLAELTGKLEPGGAVTIGGSVSTADARLPAALGAAGGVLTEMVARPVQVRASNALAITAANTLVAEITLPAGSYTIDWNVACGDTLAVGKGIVIVHTNSSNVIQSRLGGCIAGESQSGTVRRLTVAANDKIRALSGTAAGLANSLYLAHLAAHPVN